MRSILVESPDLPIAYESAGKAIHTLRDEYGSTLSSAMGMTLSVEERR